MKYIEFVKVDAGDGLPETKFPLRNGPADPLPDIAIAWWTTDAADSAPRYFGSVDDYADTEAPGIIRVITTEEWDDLVLTRRRIAQEAIDSAAGTVRVQFVSAGQFIEQEYRLAMDEVAAWRAAGSAPEDAPMSVLSGADYAKCSLEEAAVEIEQAAQDLTTALQEIRTLRLAGKRAVRECAADAITAIMQGAIDQLLAFPMRTQVPVL